MTISVNTFFHAEKKRNKKLFSSLNTDPNDILIDKTCLTAVHCKYVHAVSVYQVIPISSNTFPRFVLNSLFRAVIPNLFLVHGP